MPKRYQSFTPEFREEAAKMMVDGSRAIAQVASGGDRVPPVSASLIEQARQLKIKIETEPVMVFGGFRRARLATTGRQRPGANRTDT
jgi:transposase-like protein